MTKSRKSLIVDPGHGKVDPGANGFGVEEKDWNLRISLYQYERLKELGADVHLTRSTDKTLDSKARTDLIRGKYDLCLSNHWNAFNGKARGVETIYSVFSKPRLAQLLADAIVDASGLPLRRVFKKANSRGGDYYYMHRLTGSTQTIIIEYGFIDNRDDHDWFLNKKNFYAVAEAVIKVMCKELGIKYKGPARTTKEPAVKRPTLPEGDLYKVQAGSYGEKDNAENMHERLQDAGMDAVIMLRDGEYKVQVGAFGVKSNAEKMLKKVRKIARDAFIKVESDEPAASAPKPEPKPKKSVKEVALEIYKGKGGWGNNPGRKRKLKAEGYDYDAVQAEVENLLKADKQPKVTTVKAKDRVSLNQSARDYAVGGNIPPKYKGKVYTIHQDPRTRDGRKQVLLTEIMSWVYASDVTKV